MDGYSISGLNAYSGVVMDLVYIKDEPKVGFFRYVPTDSTSADDAAMVLVDALGRRYHRNTLVVTPEMFGAVGDGVVDDSVAIQSALDYTADKNQTILFSREYLVSKQGTVDNPGYNTSSGPPGYCLLVQNKSRFEIVFDGGSHLIFDMTGDLASLIVLKGCRDVLINQASGTALNSVEDRTHYAGALLHIISGERINVTKAYSKNLMHSVVAFRSTDCSISDGLAEKEAVMKYSTFIGLYACKTTKVEGCYCYTATGDGDIGIFGSPSEYNIIKNCYLFNYERGDASKTILASNNGGQAYYVDSGTIGCSLIGNYAYGYFYGADVKTSAYKTIVSRNVLERCNCAIAARRGEGNQTLANIIITDNQVIPDGGNGRNLAGWLAGLPLGVLLESCWGATVSNNVFENRVTAGRQDFVGVYVFGITSSITRTFVSTTNITGNRFNMETITAAVAGRSFAPSIILKGNDTPRYLSDINITGNTFDPVFDGGSDTNEGLIIADYVLNLLISSNSSSDSRGEPSIQINNCINVNIVGNAWYLHPGLVKAVACRNLNFNGNISQGIAVTGRPYLDLENTTQFSANGNQSFFAGATSGGPYIRATGNSDWIVAANNLLRLVGKNNTNWYEITGANNLIKDNLVNGTANQGTKLLFGNSVPSSGTFTIADKIQLTAPVAGGYEGFICISDGTIDSPLVSVTGSISSGTNLLTVNDASSLSVGQFISIAGVGTRQIRSVEGLLVTLETNAGATISGAAVQFVAPVFKEYSSISV